MKFKKCMIIISQLGREKSQKKKIHFLKTSIQTHIKQSTQNIKHLTYVLQMVAEVEHTWLLLKFQMEHTMQWNK